MKLAIFLAVSTVVLFGLAAWAGGAQLDIDLRGPEGTEIPVGVFDAGPPGHHCTVTLTADNNSSVHPGNDLVLRSANQIDLEGVEDAPGITVTATGLILDDTGTVQVAVGFGPDERSSVNRELVFDCEPPPTTTTTTSSTTTTTTEPHCDFCTTTTTTTVPPFSPPPPPVPCDPTERGSGCEFTG